MSKHLIISDEQIINKIFFIRGQKVMLDRDLAELYEVETKQVKRQVRRNIERFPKHFMFELSKSEFEILRSQIGTSSWGGQRYMPYAFTQHGVLMLANVLKSAGAIKMSIRIIEVFVKMSEMLQNNKDILMKLEEIERKLTKQDMRSNTHEEEIQTLFIAIRNLIEDKKQRDKPRKRIGYKLKGEE